jgi:cysteine desulfuration protein SufE
MSEFPEKLAGLLEYLELVGDRDERIQMLIDIAARFRGVPGHIARRPFPKSHLTPACESEAYVWCEELPQQALKFHFAVENPQGISAKAMAVILDETLSGESALHLAQVPSDVVYRIFGKELSMGKSMGLMSLVSMVQACAKRYLASGQADKLVGERTSGGADL